MKAGPEGRRETAFFFPGTVSAVDSVAVGVRAARYSRMNVASGVLAVIALVAIAKVICDRVESLKPAGELLGR